MFNDVSEIVWIKVAVADSIYNHEICLKEMRNNTTNLSHKLGSYQIHAQSVVT
jgi:hypothetical protein